jgi:hypothetical protein
MDLIEMGCKHVKKTAWDSGPTAGLRKDYDAASSLKRAGIFFDYMNIYQLLKKNLEYRCQIET